MEQASATVSTYINQLSENKSRAATIVFVAFTAIIIGYLIYYTVSLRNMQSSNCQMMNDAYSTINPNIAAIDSTFANPLLDYYVYGAYNACSGGAFRGGFVDVCNLKAVLKQGVRFVDFQIFNEGGQPAVATSTSSSYYVKESINSIPFAEVMSTLVANAFSDGSPNKSDPLFIHLRVMSNQTAIYDEMAVIFKQYDSQMMSTSESFAAANTNFGMVPLERMRNKIVLFVDGSNNTYLQSQPFYEYVNMVSNSPFAWLLQSYDVVNNPDIEDLTQNNMYNMSIVIPDNTSIPSNPSSSLAQQYGCQIVAMMFQQMDGYLSEYNTFFSQQGFAFALKPENLRAQPVVVEDPTPQNPAYSYQTKQVNSKLYSFKY